VEHGPAFSRPSIIEVEGPASCDARSRVLDGHQWTAEELIPLDAVRKMGCIKNDHAHRHGLVRGIGCMNRCGPKTADDDNCTGKQGSSHRSNLMGWMAAHLQLWRG
jgi:hypothetical protein